MDESRKKNEALELLARVQKPIAQLIMHNGARIYDNDTQQNGHAKDNYTLNEHTNLGPVFVIGTLTHGHMDGA